MSNFPPMLSLLSDRFHPPEDTKPTFAGRTVIVSGANVGVGYEAAVKFVQLGADRVILGVRSYAKGEAAKEQIEARTGRSGVVEVWLIDMLNYGSIKDFSTRANKELSQLHIACLNAGVASMNFERSQYGWEKTLQVNTLSTVLLALFLLPKLESSKSASFTPVLEIVSSGNHYYAGLRDEARTADSPLEFYSEAGNFNNLGMYNISKLFLQYAQRELAARVSLTNGKPAVHIVTICPGATKSTLSRDASAWYLKLAVGIFSVLLQKSTEAGARTYISGTTLGDQGHGRFWQQDRIREPAPLLVGPKNEEFQQKVFADIVRALKKDNPEISDLLSL